MRMLSQGRADQMLFYHRLGACVTGWIKEGHQWVHEEEGCLMRLFARAGHSEGRHHNQDDLDLRGAGC